MNFIHTLGAVVIVACGSIVNADVVDLSPSDSDVALSGIMNTQLSELIGTVQSDILQDFTIFTQGKGIGDDENVLYQGTLMTRVVRSNETGLLHFNYRLMNADPQFSGMISRIELNAFQGFQTRVEYRDEITAPGDEGPVDASRSADGDVLTFDFGALLDPGESSRYFFAMVDTDVFTLPTEGVQGGATATIYLMSGESVTLNVIGAGAIPAPGTLGLLGVAGLISVRRRR